MLPARLTRISDTSPFTPAMAAQDGGNRWWLWDGEISPYVHRSRLVCCSSDSTWSREKATSSFLAAHVWHASFISRARRCVFLLSHIVLGHRVSGEHTKAWDPCRTPSFHNVTSSSASTNSSDSSKIDSRHCPFPNTPPATTHQRHPALPRFPIFYQHPHRRRAN